MTLLSHSKHHNIFCFLTLTSVKDRVLGFCCQSIADGRQFLLLPLSLSIQQQAWQIVHGCEVKNIQGSFQFKDEMKWPTLKKCREVSMERKQTCPRINKRYPLRQNNCYWISAYWNASSAQEFWDEGVSIWSSIHCWMFWNLSVQVVGD